MPKRSLLLQPTVQDEITLTFPKRHVTIGDRWGSDNILCHGYVPVPTFFLEVYANLKPHPLTVGEAMFILELMSHKWDKSAPFPSYKTIAKRMAVSDKMVRRYAQSLEAKTYLHRVRRKNQTNRYDLTGLFTALDRAAHQKVIEERDRSLSKSQQPTNIFV